MKVKFCEAVYDGATRYEAGSEHDIQDAKQLKELKDRKLVNVLNENGDSDRLPCPHCDKTYANLETLTAHIKEKHPDAKLPGVE